MLTIAEIENQLCIEQARNDCFFTSQGREYIDLISGFGSVLLGHCNPEISKAIKEQIDKVGHTGRLMTPVLNAAYTMLRKNLPDSHQQVSLYSTGAETAEFAIRVASQITSRNRFMGFDKSMHGKSLATAQLCWPNDIIQLPGFARVPFLPAVSEAESIQAAESLLLKEDIAAVFVEPILGSAGGYSASNRFYDSLRQLCDRTGTLLIFDEILTGFRAGSPFIFQELNISPDIIIFGKAIGNGFPVTCIALKNEHTVTKKMLPGSTFSENPIAAASVLATLTRIQEIDLDSMLIVIAKTVNEYLNELSELGFILRGKGALWMLEIPEHLNVDEIVSTIYESNVLISSTGGHLRIMPAATITKEHLMQACSAIQNTCKKVALAG